MIAVVCTFPELHDNGKKVENWREGLNDSDRKEILLEEDQVRLAQALDCLYLIRRGAPKSNAYFSDCIF